MQLINLIALVTALAATSVNARPNPSTVVERQAPGDGVAIIRFYAGMGCEEPWLEDNVFFQNSTCTDNSYKAPYGSFRVYINDFTRTTRFYVNTECGGTNYVDVQPGVEQCFSGRVGSYKSL
ncbi:hypothetical protein J4E90_002813 [Alternaria incomplexa]|uniref:uncharacterized protein n=1 Tax=Alternaria incomplexa TaxID=1187928 RepID=UPI00221FF12E|nr:uncharacterized protein J4E90_002813 [Alternaria incomplexa]KAI4918429.1 hypothetical protein J4E90_002813 [Alternaria incomplexa]